MDDKNKSDGLARYLDARVARIATDTHGVLRSITIFQVLFFTISTSARLAQHLVVTTLELTTLAFVFAMLVCSGFWRAKPKDVNTPIVLESRRSMNDVRLEVCHSFD